MRVRAGARALGATLVACLLVVPGALANGDPPSDVLPYETLYRPIALGPPQESIAGLKRVIREANQSGFTVRVALVGGRLDLGTVGALWRKPQPYATFLSQELLGPSPYVDRVLVVMPNGYGLSRNGTPLPAERRVLDRLPAPEAAGDDLARAANDAIQRLAALHGIRLEGDGEGGGGFSAGRLAITAAAVVLVGLGVALELVRRRRPAG